MRALTVLAIVLLGASGAAQDRDRVSYAAPNYYVSALELGDGEVYTGSTYVLHPSMAEGIVPEPGSDSPSYVIRGGFPSMVKEPTVGSPALTGADPFFVQPTGSASISLLGFDLLSGGSPAISIGGQPALVTAVSSSMLQVTVPDQAVPGYQPVVLTSAAAPSLVEHGVGVLPMMFTREPLTPITPIEVHFQGSQNDIVVLALAYDLAATPLQVPDFRHALMLDINTILAVASLGIANQDGSYVIRGPALPIVGELFLQALVFTTAPGYGPASFTNEVVL